MKTVIEPTGFASRTYRRRVLLGMMVVVVAVSALGLYFAEISTARNVENSLQQQSRAQLAAVHQLQEIRHAALVERCRALIRKPRLHAALEDNALDLLYLSAKDELQDLMDDEQQPEADAVQGLRARFYRFLDRNGKVIPAPPTPEFGELSAHDEAALALPHVPEKQQIGYLQTEAQHGGVSELIAMPIRSTETGDVIAAIVLGFRPLAIGNDAANQLAIRTGIYVNGKLEIESYSPTARAQLTNTLTELLKNGPNENTSQIDLDGTPTLVVTNPLNPDSLFPPAYEVCAYPLTQLVERNRALRWQILGAGGLLLVVGLATSHLVAGRLSAPVEQLAMTSEQNRARRERAEAALESTSVELQRSARFSSDASHQLKTPVTVLRAGLEELLARPNLTVEECNELAGLVHQTYRLSNIIEDLLLLSRMDAGRLKLDFSDVNLTALIDGWLDDLSALPDPLELTVETDVPPNLLVKGEKRYTTLILQNLLENARKYNCRGGKIRITAHADGEWVTLSVSNTGRPIPPSAHEHIFERFHRGVVGENVPGHGLGLNLARELARNHRGDLRLAQSDENWTTFEVRFQAASAVAAPPKEAI